MRKYTQEEFAGFEVVNGVTQCPVGDYSLIESFGESCRFGAFCTFGARCSFGAFCTFGASCSFENKGFGSKILQIRAGSFDRTSTAFYLDTGIYIRSGCFSGTLEEFETQVEKTHGDNVHGKTYKLWCEIIRINQ